MLEAPRSSGYVLDATKSGWLIHERVLHQYSQISVDDIIRAHERSIAIVSSPERIVVGYEKLSSFAAAVTNEFPDDIVGGFLEGLPFCLVPHAKAIGQLDLLVNPEILFYQGNALENIKKAARIHNNLQLPCMSCMIEQNAEDDPNLNHLNTACGPCDLVTATLKPREAKKPLVDFDIIFVTKKQLGSEKRKRIWELANLYGFAPIYQHLDLIMQGRMDPIDLWLFEETEINRAMHEMSIRPDWYNQKAYPYDFYRYLTGSISSGNRDDIPFAPDTVFQFQPFGNNEFIHRFRATMKTLVRREIFAGDLISLLSNRTAKHQLQNYWNDQPMWPPELQRLYFSTGNLHPLIDNRIRGFIDYQPPASVSSQEIPPDNFLFMRN